MPDMPRTKFNSPWTVENIETELNGTKNARGNLTMTEKLAQKVETSTYATDKAALDAEIAAVANAGAKNLLKNIRTTTTHKGITFTINDDGSVTANGTNDNTGVSVLDINTQASLALPNGDYILTGCPAGGSDSGYMMDITRSQGSSIKDTGNGTAFTVGGDYTVTEFRIVISRNITVNNLTFYPMIRPASITDSTFVPYAKTNRELTVENDFQQAEINYAINTGAKNLLNVTASSGVLNTATIDIADDGSIHISGQPTSNGAYVLSSGIDLVITENAYILSMGAEAGDTKMSLSLRRKGTSQYVDLYHAESRIIPSGTYDRAHIYLYSDTDYDTTVYPMIRPAAIKDPIFEPYALSNPVLTPAVIKATDDGAKNKLPITIQSQTVRTVQFAVNGDGSITANGTVTGGDVYLNFETSIGDKYVGMILSGGTANLKICISKEGSGQIAVYSDSSKGVEIPDNATNTLFLFAANGTQLSNVTVKPMICTASDWAVSQKFVPYCPTLYELYQMVLALQTGRSVQSAASLMRAGRIDASEQTEAELEEEADA